MKRYRRSFLTHHVHLPISSPHHSGLRDRISSVPDIRALQTPSTARKMEWQQAPQGQESFPPSATSEFYVLYREARNPGPVHPCLGRRRHAWKLVDI